MLQHWELIIHKYRSKLYSTCAWLLLYKLAQAFYKQNVLPRILLSYQEIPKTVQIVSLHWKETYISTVGSEVLFREERCAVKWIDQEY